VRLKLELVATKDQSYDNDYNYKVQSFIYNLIRYSQFHNIHDSNGIAPSDRSVTPFCFSNIFPYGDMKQNDSKSLIISSPNDKFINLIFTRLKESNSLIVIGRLEFKLTDVKMFIVKMRSPQKVYTSTPIIIRVPEKQYRHYNIELKHSFKYLFWRNTYPLELLIRQLEINLTRKFFHYYKRHPNSSISFNKLVFMKQVSKKLTVHSSVQTIIGTLWEFWIDEVNELTKFAIDSGLGERNRLGFGFLNKSQ
jgi:CRISPR-associated endoribonuclease Cas6